MLYLGSFSKTLFPGLRLGYLVADQPVAGGGAGDTLAEALSPIKSLVTVNTPAPMQAVAGGILVEEGFSLRRLVGEKIPFYRRNRDRMLAALEAHLAGSAVRWNRPGGGFFLTVTLPFVFDEECLRQAAGEYGVIVCPMSYFALLPGRERQVRLSFSYVSEAQIDDGVARFARFVAARSAA